MKLKITKEFRDYATGIQLDQAKAYIKNWQRDTEDEKTELDQAAALAAHAVGCGIVLKYDFELSRNSRLWDDETGTTDIWLTVYALGDDDFCIVGAYISDIWSYCPDYKDDILQHMYIRRYKKVGA